VRIRQKILERLPTGSISKQRTPEIHEVTINFKLDYRMADILQHRPFNRAKSPTNSFRLSTVTIGSQREAQGLTVEDYIAQTWPTTGLQLLEEIENANMNSPQRSHSKSEFLQEF
jgi:hypothetical protein